MTTLLIALTLYWTTPVCNATGFCTPDFPAQCVEVAVLWVPRKIGPRWWEQPTVTDTLAKIPVTDGQPCSYLLPLWVGEGTCIVISRDAAGNWSRHSNYTGSWR